MSNLKRVTNSQDLNRMVKQSNISDCAASNDYKDPPETVESFVMIEQSDYTEPSREQQIREIEQFLRALSVHKALPSSMKGAGCSSLSLFKTPHVPEDTTEFVDSREEIAQDDILRDNHDELDEIGTAKSSRHSSGSEESSSASNQNIRDQGSRAENQKGRKRRIMREIVENLSILERSHSPAETDSDFRSSSSSSGSSDGLTEMFLAELERLKVEESVVGNVCRQQKETEVEKRRANEDSFGFELDTIWDEVTLEILVAAAANGVLFAALWGLSARLGV